LGGKTRITDDLGPYFTVNNKIVYYPKVNVDADSLPPDAWDSAQGLIPPDDFVVSRSRDGAVLAKYSDNSWDLSPYHPRGQRQQLYFYLFEDGSTPPGGELLLGEMRYLAFILIWKRPGSPLSISSLNNYAIAFRQLGCFAFGKGCAIKDILNSQKLLAEFAHTAITGNSLKVISALLALLCKLGPEQVGFPVLGKVYRKILNPLIYKYFSALKQYPPIPTRIYSYLIASLSAEIVAWEAVEARYLALLEECLNDVLLGKSKSQQVTIGTKRRIRRVPGDYRDNFAALLVKYDLVSYFERNELSPSVHGLVHGLSAVMYAAKLQIVLFSGMRNAEARHLPYNCLEEEKSSGGVIHRLIVGDTTKLQVRRTRWVTSVEGHCAVRVVQRIADVVYTHLGDRPTKGGMSDNRYPLFVSLTYLGFTLQGQKTANGLWKVMSDGFHSEKFDRLRTRIQPLIEEGDLKELEHIDPHRAWRTEDEFQLGVPWRLTEHQLRRSLALYAQRSGLVSLPSLRRQLQHITEEMSRYYARGSVFAKNFIGEDKEHFGWEWQKAVPVSSGLAFIRDVLFADEPIFGGYAKWISHRVGSSEGAILLDRDATMRRFKNGEIAYKETPIGGCTKVGPCDEVAIRFLDVDCLGGCPNLVGRLSKLEQTISGQTTLLNRLKPDSIEWRIEKADLDVLLETRARVLQKGEEGE
jgi:hypothetical protein